MEGIPDKENKENRRPRCGGGEARSISGNHQWGKIHDEPGNVVRGLVEKSPALSRGVGACTFCVEKLPCWPLSPSHQQPWLYTFPFIPPRVDMA